MTGYSIRKIFQNLFRNRRMYLLLMLQFAVGIGFVGYVFSISVSEQKAIREAELQNPANEIRFGTIGDLEMMQGQKFPASELQYLEEDYRDEAVFSYAYKDSLQERDENGDIIRSYNCIYCSEEYFKRLGITDVTKVYAGRTIIDYAEERFQRKVEKLEDVVEDSTALWHSTPVDRWNEEIGRIQPFIPILTENTILAPIALMDGRLMGEEQVMVYFDDMSEADQVCKEVVDHFQRKLGEKADLQYMYESPLMAYIQQCKTHDMVIYLPEIKLMAISMVLVLCVGFTGALSILTYHRKKQLAIALTLGATFRTILGEYIGEMGVVCLGGLILGSIGTIVALSHTKQSWYVMHFQPEVLAVTVALTVLVIFITTAIIIGDIREKKLVQILRTE